MARRVQRDEQRTGLGPVPEENQPGHHPRHEQDRPDRPPPSPRHRRFPFHFEGLPGSLARLVGATPDRAYVDLDGDRLEARYGPWVVHTTLDNVTEAHATGPYHAWKVGGPPRVSLRDRGLTFATTSAEGVCIRFARPVTGSMPVPFLHHGSLTVTVEDPDRLVAALDPALR